MRAHPGTRALIVVMAGLALALGPTYAAAQEEGSDTEPTGDGVRRPPPPRSGSLFGNRPPQQSAGEAGLTDGQVDRTETADEDGRTQLLVFDLIYEDGATFQESYLERFETTLWEAVEASPEYRPLDRAERQRRLARSAALATGELRDDDAERMAGAIGVTHYLIPRVEVANSRTYRIRLTFGTVGAGEDGRRHVEQESNRTIDNVDNAIEALVAQALQ